MVQGAGRGSYPDGAGKLHCRARTGAPDAAGAFRTVGSARPRSRANPHAARAGTRGTPMTPQKSTSRAVLAVQCAGVALHGDALLSGIARCGGKLSQILSGCCAAGRGAVSGDRVLPCAGSLPRQRGQHHRTGVGDAGAVGHFTGGCVYERKFHESYYKCSRIITRIKQS